MSMSAANHGSAGRRRSGRSRRNRHAPMSEINVTPMVDVMLVLLIVFMVAAPLLTVGVPIDLPQTQAKSLDTQAKPLTLTVTANGQIYIGDNQVTLEKIVETLGSLSGGKTDQRIYLRGDAKAGYGMVMRVMGMLSSAGYSKIGLITNQEQGQ
ncbi:Tol biopolymer transport system, TolR protein [hydrothermal vent metagenome]|uniref:Tol biopolymer transport system, TolR protein n=1 Tax=hydrothermal vent metagenome TaxID=652676 RepID=A0A3B0UF40_9ZZZZ